MTEMRIIECMDCSYTALNCSDRTECKHCGGKLEVIAQQVKHKARRGK